MSVLLVQPSWFELVSHCATRFEFRKPYIGEVANSLGGKNTLLLSEEKLVLWAVLMQVGILFERCGFEALPAIKASIDGP
jgi:hypothetical protein